MYIVSQGSNRMIKYSLYYYFRNGLFENDIFYISQRNNTRLWDLNAQKIIDSKTLWRVNKIIRYHTNYYKMCKGVVIEHKSSAYSQSLYKCVYMLQSCVTRNLSKNPLKSHISFLPAEFPSNYWFFMNFRFYALNR